MSNEQSFMSRMGAKVLPFFASRVFPQEWVDAGDDRARLIEIAKKRRANDGPRPDLVLQRKWGRASTDIAGRNLYLLTPKGGSTGRVSFYCHGGAFVVGPSSLEWLFAARFATSLGCDLALYDYPKVPEHESSHTLESTREAYRAIAERYGSDITIGGTSAGGGLAMATMLQLHRTGEPLPQAAALFSPWLDMTISHPEAPSYVESDKLLPLERLRRDGELYAGTHDAKNPLVSPRFASAAELAAMPRTFVTAGDREILLPEAQEFVANMNAAGSQASLHIERFGQHAGVLGNTPEAAGVLQELVTGLRSTTSSRSR